MNMKRSRDLFSTAFTVERGKVLLNAERAVKRLSCRSRLPPAIRTVEKDRIFYKIATGRSLLQAAYAMK
jgi:hypothetical protein